MHAAGEGDTARDDMDCMQQLRPGLYQTEEAGVVLEQEDAELPIGTPQADKAGTHCEWSLLQEQGLTRLRYIEVHHQPGEKIPPGRLPVHAQNCFVPVHTVKHKAEYTVVSLAVVPHPSSNESNLK